VCTLEIPQCPKDNYGTKIYIISNYSDWFVVWWENTTVFSVVNVHFLKGTYFELVSTTLNKIFFPKRKSIDIKNCCLPTTCTGAETSRYVVRVTNYVLNIQIKHIHYYSTYIYTYIRSSVRLHMKIGKQQQLLLPSMAIKYQYLHPIRPALQSLHTPPL
jgi:hypothetical protein